MSIQDTSDEILVDATPVKVPTFFDSNVPDDVNERIIHFLSRCPSFVYPKRYVNTSDVLAVLGSSNALRSQAKEQFRSLFVSSGGSREISNVYFDHASYKIESNQNRLHVHDKGLISPLLSSLAGSLEVISLCASDVLDLDDKLWMRVARHLNDLTTWKIDSEFPLDRVLRGCHSLKTLSLTFVRGSEVQQHLELVAERVSKITDLRLRNVNDLGSCAHVWPLFQCLEKLEIAFGRIIPAPPADTIYEGIAHPDSRLQSLELDIKHDGEDYFDAALDLCQRIGHNLIELKVNVRQSNHENPAYFSKFSQLKEACPKVAVYLCCCDIQVLLPAMQALGNSLLEVSVEDGWETDFTNIELTNCARICTKLRSATLNLYISRSEEFVELLLSRVGLTLRELNVFTAPKVAEKATSSLFIERIANNTGNLIRFEIGKVNPKVSYHSIAVANPKLRGVVFVFNFESSDREYGRLDAEQWVVRTVTDFTENCRYLEDIYIWELGEENANSPLFPANNRIKKLDNAMFSRRKQRNLGVRVGTTSYST